MVAGRRLHREWQFVLRKDLLDVVYTKEHWAPGFCTETLLVFLVFSVTNYTNSPRTLDNATRIDTSQGTYKLSNADVTKPVLNALQQGYRLIDTAQVPSATSAAVFVCAVCWVCSQHDYHDLCVVAAVAPPERSTRMRRVLASLSA